MKKSTITLLIVVLAMLLCMTACKSEEINRIETKDKNEALLTAYQRMGSVNNEVKILKVAGLDAEKTYYVPELGQTFMGSTLMNVGICPSFEQGDFMTVKYHFVADV